MELLTLEKWEEHCAKNCKDSYSMGVILAILLLWEENAIVRCSEKEVLSGYGFSGAQAEMAIGFATNHKTEWMIKEFTKESYAEENNAKITNTDK